MLKARCVGHRGAERSYPAPPWISRSIWSSCFRLGCQPQCQAAWQTSCCHWSRSVAARLNDFKGDLCPCVCVWTDACSVHSVDIHLFYLFLIGCNYGINMCTYIKSQEMNVRTVQWQRVLSLLTCSTVQQSHKKSWMFLYKHKYFFSLSTELHLVKL